MQSPHQPRIVTALSLTQSQLEPTVALRFTWTAQDLDFPNAGTPKRVPLRTIPTLGHLWQRIREQLSGTSQHEYFSTSTGLLVTRVLVCIPKGVGGFASQSWEREPFLAPEYHALDIWSGHPGKRHLVPDRMRIEADWPYIEIRMEHCGEGGEVVQARREQCLRRQRRFDGAKGHADDGGHMVDVRDFAAVQYVPIGMEMGMDTGIGAGISMEMEESVGQGGVVGENVQRRASGKRRSKGKQRESDDVPVFIS